MTGARRRVDKSQKRPYQELQLANPDTNLPPQPKGATACCAEVLDGDDGGGKRGGGGRWSSVLVARVPPAAAARRQREEVSITMQAGITDDDGSAASTLGFSATPSILLERKRVDMPAPPKTCRPPKQRRTASEEWLLSSKLLHHEGHAGRPATP